MLTVLQFIVFLLLLLIRFFVISRLKPSLVSRHVNREPDVRVLTVGTWTQHQRPVVRSAAPELQSAGLSEEGEPLLEPSDRGRLSVKGGDTSICVFDTTRDMTAAF